MKSNKKGFTLIELLVVIAIIGVLASVVLSSMSTARKKTRDSKRISEMKSLETALELYYLDNGDYPHYSAHTFSGTDANISAFMLSISPYIDINLLNKYYLGDDSRFYYMSKSSQGYQNYGMMVHLESSTLGASDGGYYSDYELGQNPKYCKDAYPSGSVGRWVQGVTRCQGGN